MEIYLFGSASALTKDVIPSPSAMDGFIMGGQKYRYPNRA